NVISSSILSYSNHLLFTNCSLTCVTSIILLLPFVFPYLYAHYNAKLNHRPAFYQIYLNYINIKGRLLIPPDQLLPFSHFVLDQLLLSQFSVVCYNSPLALFFIEPLETFRLCTD